jgi:single-stranded-DNA-specific exonuclease
MEPVGAGNPMPYFLARDLELLEAKPMGNSGEHMRLRVRNDRGAWSAVGFGLGTREAELTSRLDIVYYWTRDDYLGQPLLGLAVRDFLPAGLAFQGRLF